MIAVGGGEQRGPPATVARRNARALADQPFDAGEIARPGSGDQRLVAVLSRWPGLSSKWRGRPRRKCEAWPLLPRRRTTPQQRFRAANGVVTVAAWTSEPARPTTTTLPATIYLAAFVTGAIVMSFEMLGSRYLNPYFGSGIYTWASLISTVLAALCVGYFIGGVAADRYPSARVLGATVLIGSAYILVLPAFSERCMEFVLGGLRRRDAPAASPPPSRSCSSRSRFSACIRRSASGCCCARRKAPAAFPGTVYGVSTAGSIVGTLGTTFFLIPAIGTRAITFTLGIAGILSGLLLIAAAKAARRRACARASSRSLVAGRTRRGPDRSDDPRRNAQARRRPRSRISRPSTTTSSSPSGATS